MPICAPIWRGAGQRRSWMETINERMGHVPEWEVIVMTSNPESIPWWESEEELSLDELARRQGVKPVTSLHDMAVPGLFDDDEEYEAFLIGLGAWSSVSSARAGARQG